jgi:hypothetical protein
VDLGLKRLDSTRLHSFKAARAQRRRARAVSATPFVCAMPKGDGRGRPKGAKGKPKGPATMSGGTAMRPVTAAAAAAQLFPGVARAAGFQGGADRGATASARTQPALDVAEEEFHSCDEDSDDDGGEEGEVREGEGTRVEKSRYVKSHPVLAAVSAAVKTLPRVVGQTRVGQLDLKAWPDYEFRLPLATLRSTIQPPDAHILRKAGPSHLSICLFGSSMQCSTAQLDLSSNSFQCTKLELSPLQLNLLSLVCSVSST